MCSGFDPCSIWGGGGGGGGGGYNFEFLPFFRDMGFWGDMSNHISVHVFSKVYFT